MENKFNQFRKWYKPNNDFSYACFTSINWVCEKFKPDYVIELGRSGGNSLKSLDICVEPEVLIDSVDIGEYFIPELSERVKQNVFNFCSDKRQYLIDNIEKHERIFIFWDIHDNEAVKKFCEYFYPVLKDKLFCLYIHDFYMSDDPAEFTVEAMLALKDYCENASNGFAEINIGKYNGFNNVYAKGFKEIALFYEYFNDKNVKFVIPKSESMKIWTDAVYFEENIYDTKYGAIGAYSNAQDISG